MRDVDYYDFERGVSKNVKEEEAVKGFEVSSIHDEVVLVVSECKNAVRR